MTDGPQSTIAWNTGALGEERLGRRLDELSSETMRVLHDRRIPGTRADIDHIAVTPTGIFVIDAKKYRGRPSLKVEGGILRPRVEKLLVGTRDQTKLVDGVLNQVDVVQGIVGDDLPRHSRPMLHRSGLAAPRRLLHHPRRGGPLAQEAVRAAHHRRPDCLWCRRSPPHVGVRAPAGMRVTRTDRRPARQRRLSARYRVTGLPTSLLPGAIRREPGSTDLTNQVRR